MERVADYIIESLVEHGIKHIFMITGRGILYLTDAVAKCKGIKGVSTYHEQGASYAAMAYAAASNELSACLVSTGCAATNAVTATLCAYQDNLPIIFISGQNPLHETTRFTGAGIRTYGSQETDIIPVVESITKYATMIQEPQMIAYEMDRAFYLAKEGRRGPVWIDVPLDIQNARIEPNTLKRYIAPIDNNYPDTTDIEYVEQSLKKAKRPVLFVGGGVRSEDALSCLANIVEKTKIPVVFSASASDIYGSGNKLSIGAVGSLGGSRAGNIAVQNADFILVLASKLCSQTIGSEGKQFGREAKIIVVDIDPTEHNQGTMVIDSIIRSDVSHFLEQMNTVDLPVCSQTWIDQCLHWKERFAVHREQFVKDILKQKKIDLYSFSCELSRQMQSDATVITDAGFEELIIPSAITFRERQRCLFPAAQGAMGYAIPAILGAYYAGKKDIIAVVGDGSIMMNLQELLIISQNNIPAKIFVINNNMYAVIRRRQQDLFRKRTIGNDPSDGVPAPDFRKIAECFGFRYEQIHDSDKLEQGIRHVLAEDEPCICEVNSVEQQPYLHMSYAVNERRRLIKRPLEDLSPFLERDIMEKEMVIPMMPE